MSKTCGSFRSPNREKIKVCTFASVVRVDRRIDYKIVLFEKFDGSEFVRNLNKL